MSRRAARCASAVLLGLLTLSGCASPGGGASAHNDVDRCAAVLPMARDVVHGHGTLTLVRPINQAGTAQITAQVTGTPPTTPTARPPHSASAHALKQRRPPKTCLIVYRGDYPAGSLAGSVPPGAGGHYALILLRVRHPVVDRVLVADTLPAAAHRSWWHF